MSRLHTHFDKMNRNCILIEFQLREPHPSKLLVFVGLLLTAIASYSYNLLLLKYIRRCDASEHEQRVLGTRQKWQREVTWKLARCSSNTMQWCRCAAHLHWTQSFMNYCYCTRQQRQPFFNKKRTASSIHAPAGTYSWRMASNII